MIISLMYLFTLYHYHDINTITFLSFIGTFLLYLFTNLIFILQQINSIISHNSKVNNKKSAFIEEWMNTLPRRILNYKTPEELFEAHLDKIYTI